MNFVAARTVLRSARVVASRSPPSLLSLRRRRSSSSSIHRSTVAVAAASSSRPGLPLLVARPTPAFSPSLCRRIVSVASASSAATATEAEMVAAEPPKPIFRKDYKPLPYAVEQVNLTFDLHEDDTTVTSVLTMKPNFCEGVGGGDKAPELVLDGRADVELVSVSVDGTDVPSADREITPKNKLVLSKGLPTSSSSAFKLEIVTRIKPSANTSLEGLYVSGGNFCTQCEAEGFRGITFFPDRPDVMARYTTKLVADKDKFPVLLSNGNKVDEGEEGEGGGRHYAVWEDPFPKPCYLFALVAGDLALTEGTFKTKSGRDVALRFYCEARDASKVGFAIESLKKAMKWDEEAFGLEYDLDLFNVVAVSDFVMGAMENKSLNVFNSRLVLASPTTATDVDYGRIEGVIGHEYFHNWTGNRVTCRDWFQLTLKEGLTVYRDQEFSADVGSRPVKRIDDVCRLRAAQFSEDAGAMAHPIRPESYIKMDNFYTLTVYEKGAEVVRMYERVLGKEGFRKGMDLYFDRHDGQAVTCDDFRSAMADANGADLSLFARWYEQAGTPEVTVTTSYDAPSRTFVLKASQRTPSTPGQSDKEPVPIPIAAGLLSSDGTDLEPVLSDEDSRGVRLVTEEAGGKTRKTAVLLLDAAERSWTFRDVAEAPAGVSLLRGFSAPVRLRVVGQTEEQLLFLAANDSDEFNRWEAGQTLARGALLGLYESAKEALKSAGAVNGNGSNGGAAASNGSSAPSPVASAAADAAEAAAAAAGPVPKGLFTAFASVLADASLDGAFASAALTLPQPSELVDAVPGGEADPLLLHAVRRRVVRELAAANRPALEAAVKANDDAADVPYSPEFASAARRAIKNKALSYLAALHSAKDADASSASAFRSEVLKRARDATNMTDRVAALACLVDSPRGTPEREAALSEFHDDNKDEPLVLLKWLALQAGSDAPGNVAAARELSEHPAFVPTNPNCCYSLYLAFVRSAPNFHAADGSGYEFVADAVLRVDKVNKQVAARIAGAFTSCAQFDAARRSMIQSQLRKILEADSVSENVYEIVSKSLEK